MLKIYLVRHGQDQDNANKILNGRRDTPLTEKGLEQAQELAEKIKETGISFSAAYSSPLKRAYKTASTITNALGLKNPIELQDLIDCDLLELSKESSPENAHVFKTKQHNA